MSRFLLSLPLTLALLVIGSTAFADTRVALVLGNSAYEAVGPLPNPQRDAALVAETLKSQGFAVTLVQNASRASMLRALNKFNDLADSADWALVYYAGHGIEVGGTNYLLPTDAQLKVDRDAQDEGVSLNRVLDSVTNARKLRVVILDACRNNPFARNMRSSTRAVTRGLSRPEPQAGILVIYAAAAGETAEDGVGGHSPFTTALSSRLKQPGLEVNRLFNVVTADVLASTGQRQRPYLYGSNPIAEELYFTPPAVPSVAPASPAAPPDDRIWAYLKVSKDLAMLRAFRDGLPAKSLLRPEVEMRLAALSNAQGVPARVAETPPPASGQAPAPRQEKLAALAPPKTEAQAPVEQPNKSDEAAWQAVKNSKDVADLRRFIRAFPGSAFRSQANARLALLSPSISNPERPVKRQAPQRRQQVSRAPAKARLNCSIFNARRVCE